MPTPFPTKIVTLALSSLLLVACANDYVLANKDSVDFNQRLLAIQSATQSELIEQQGELAKALKQVGDALEQQTRLAPVLQRLDHTLSAPLKITPPTIHVTTPVVAQPVSVQAKPPPPSSAAQPSPPTDNKQWVGAVEQTWFPELKVILESRIDTGAQTSSLHVDKYEIIERDGSKWVRFSIVQPKGTQTAEVFERKLIRQVRILQSTSADSERRPVVNLEITIGNVTQKADFTLADREDLTYEVLIGRNALRDLMVVDVAKTNLTKLPKDAKTE